MTKTKSALALAEAGLTHSQIAEQIGSTKRSVAAMLSNARRKQRAGTGDSPTVELPAAIDRERIIALGLPLLLKGMGPGEIARVLWLAFGPEVVEGISDALAQLGAGSTR